MNSTPALASSRLPHPTLGWLRVLLAAMVIDLHYGLVPADARRWLEAKFGAMAWVNDGAIAVFGFFAISGYLVSEMIRAGRYPLGDARDFFRFVLSRWVRIYPLYWLVLMAWMLTHSWPGWLKALANVLLWPYGLWAFFYDQRQWGPLFKHLELVPAWTLAIDLVLYPIGALLARHRSAFLGIWLLLSLAWWACAAWLDPAQLGEAGYVWWHFRYWTGAGPAVFAFVLGMVFQRFGSLIPSEGWVGWVAFLVILWCCYLPLGLGYFSASMIATLALAWLVHMLAARGRGPQEAFLGQFTYALYLTHVPVMYWIWEAIRPQHVTLQIIAVLGSVLAAILLSKYFEAPLEAYRRKLFSSPKSIPDLAQSGWGQGWLILMTLGMTCSTVTYVAMAWSWRH